MVCLWLGLGVWKWVRFFLSGLRLCGLGLIRCMDFFWVVVGLMFWFFVVVEVLV